MGWEANPAGGCVNCGCGPCTGTLCVTLDQPTDRCTGPLSGTRTFIALNLATSASFGSSVEPSGTACVAVPAGNYRINGSFARTGGGTGGYGYTAISSVAVACGATTNAATALIGPCACLSPPSPLSLTVTYGVGETAATYGHQYQDSTLQYYCGGADIPSYMPLSAFSGQGYYSTASWVDDSGFIDYFRISCFGNIFTLGLGQYAGGLWFAPGQVYTWNLSNAGNTCSPFLLSAGNPAAGSGFGGHFFAS